MDGWQEQTKEQIVGKQELSNRIDLRPDCGVVYYCCVWTSECMLHVSNCCDRSASSSKRESKSIYHLSILTDLNSYEFGWIPTHRTLDSSKYNDNRSNSILTVRDSMIIEMQTIQQTRSLFQHSMQTLAFDRIAFDVDRSRFRCDHPHRFVTGPEKSRSFCTQHAIRTAQRISFATSWLTTRSSLLNSSCLSVRLCLPIHLFVFFVWSISITPRRASAQKCGTRTTDASERADRISVCAPTD